MSALSRLFSRFGKSLASDGGGDRRTHHRQSIDCLAIAVLGGRSITVQVESISPSGAFVTPRLEAVKGSQCTLRIPEARASMTGRIARHGQNGTGLYFDDPASAEHVIEMFAAA